MRRSEVDPQPQAARGIAGGVALVCLRLLGVLERAVALLRGSSSGFFSALLTAEEKRSLASSIYARAGSRGPLRPLSGWERAWFAQRLPAPPARVLVGGAGTGAEVRFLLDQGYRVDALEPTPLVAKRCGDLIGSRGIVAAASYEQLAEAVLDGSETPASIIADLRYDAILLGWGSLSHVLAATERERLLRACHALARSGPILASCLVGDVASRGGRGGLAAISLGRRMAGLLGRVSDDDPAAQAFLPWAGFCHVFIREEIEHLSGHAGRRLIWEQASEPAYPHMTFLPE